MSCQTCLIPFNIFIRRHHCRCCGGIFCSECVSIFFSLLLFAPSPSALLLPSFSVSMRDPLQHIFTSRHHITATVVYLVTKVCIYLLSVSLFSPLHLFFSFLSPPNGSVAYCQTCLILRTCVLPRLCPLFLAILLFSLSSPPPSPPPFSIFDELVAEC